MTEQHQLSTDAKILIKEWQTLEEKIVEHTQFTPPSLLTDEQLNDALNGPLQCFFKEKLNAYATVTRIRFLLTLAQDETFKNAPRENLSLAITNNELEPLKQSLNELTDIHYQQWLTKRNTWNVSLAMTLTQNNITLSEIEAKEVEEQEPLSQLMNRFIDLNITIPSIKIMNFEQYLRLKIYLILHSSLSRQQQAHDDVTIHKLLKKFNKDFHQIHQEEMELVQLQHNETREVIKILSTAASQ